MKRSGFGSGECRWGSTDGGSGRVFSVFVFDNASDYTLVFISKGFRE